jgi:hypothetical protein
MQHDNAPAVRRLCSELAMLRGLWPGYEADLHRMGFSALAELRGQDANALANDYCRLSGRPVDPLLSSCFSAVVNFAETGVPTPWWRIMRAQAKREREAVVSAAARGQRAVYSIL